MLLIRQQHRFQLKTMLYVYINIGFFKNWCCMYKLTLVLVKTDVNLKIFDFFYNSYYIKSIFLKNRCCLFYVSIGFGKSMLTVLLSTSVLLTSVNNRCSKSLITNVKILFYFVVVELYFFINIYARIKVPQYQPYFFITFECRVYIPRMSMK